MKKSTLISALMLFLFMAPFISNAQAEGKENFAIITVQEKTNYATVCVTIGGAPTEVKKFDYAAKTNGLHENMDILTVEMEMLANMGFELFSVSVIKYDKFQATAPDYVVHTYVFKRNK